FWQNDGTELYGSWSLKPSTRYTVTLGAGARDRFGQPIDGPLTWSFDTRATEPGISLVTEGPIGMYSAYDDMTVAIQHVNVSRINLDLYELSPEELVTLTREGGWPDWDRFAVRSGSRIASWVLESRAPLNSQEVLYSGLPGGAESALEPGIYLLIAKAPEISRPERHAFVVSPFNITLKTTAEDALVWVTDLQDGEPLAGVDVSLYDYNGDLAAQGSTDRDGLLMLEMPVQERWESVTVVAESTDGMGAVVSNWSDGISPWDFQLSAAWETRAYRGHLFTDRRIYRPGQSVNFKAILRLDHDGQYSLPEPGTSVEVSLTDSEGQAVWSETLALGDFGSVDGQIALSESASLGYYSLVLRVGEEYIDNSFQVAEYRAPEFMVSVATDETEYVAGDTMQLTVDASFYFGGAVSEANVQWRVFADPYYFDRWNGEGSYTFGEYDYSYDPQTRALDTGLLTEGVGQTDADGRFTVSIPTDLEGANSRRFTVQASVVDLNNQEVTGETFAVVHAGALYIGLNADRYVGMAGEPMKVGLLTADTMGTAVGRATVDIAISRQEWYSVQKLSEDGEYVWQNEVRETPVYTETARTGAAGTAQVSWTPPEGGTYKVLAQARDEQGNTVRSALYVWASGTAFVNWGRENNYRIDLVADHASYAPGDVASILVPSPYEGPVTALLTVERGGILEYRVVELTSNSEMLELPILPEYAPNVFVSLVVMSGTGGDDSEPGYRVGMVMLPVSTVERELDLTITAGQTGAYQPGDKAEFKIRVTDHRGSPVQADLAVQLVDLAIETLIGGMPPDILDAFYRERGLAVNTALSLVRRHLPEEPTADEGKGGGGAGDDAGLRTEFPETALWEPSVLTDENGEAVVSVILPDNLTTWRLTAQAATGETLVGVGRLDIISSLDVMVRPALPRFLVVGDAPRLGT
ncbi:MAG: MG2 domain-containing protein, partial [Anaerolineae bacterium]